ncbi:MAG TPA: heavy metal translocating P-type ATPase, partial [bacterium]|nr:heavy metal translocating P-type ATPase [bacterium]
MMKTIEIETAKFTISGMDCPSCAEGLKRTLLNAKGIISAEVDFTAATVEVGFDGGVTTPSQIGVAIRKSGYENRIADAAGAGGETARGANRLSASTVISGVLIAAAFVCGRLFGAHSASSYFLYLAAIAAGGWFTAKKAFVSLKNKSIDMNVLMAAAVAGAVAIGELQEGATVVFLFAVANLLESFSMERARNAVKSLMRIAPRKAVVIRDGANVETDVENVSVGEVIVIRPGEKIPMDGEVESGESDVDEAPITGESMPVGKAAGDIVYAGALNGLGALEVRVTKLFRDSTISRIIHITQEAQARKASSQRAVDRFAKYYTPLVILGALAVMLAPPLLLG